MNGSPKDLFKVWHYVYEKTYSLDTQEAKDRFRAFKDNLKFIREHNAKNLEYKLGLNQFSDMTHAEYKEKMCTKKVVKGEEFDKLVETSKFNPVKDDDDDDLTKRRFLAGLDNIDYRNFYNSARNQGNCGCCWAFATAGAVEGAYGLKNGMTYNYLSPQHLVDCDKNNNGCNGGNSLYAYRYVATNGIHFESFYPYQGKVGICKYSNEQPLNLISSYSYCSNYSNNSERKCNFQKVYDLLKNGPGTIGIDASSREFNMYSSGIFSAQCSADNHAVILVGFGTDSNGTQYWVVRNTWGENWGEKGYIRVKVDESNNYSCFVTNEVIVPIL